MAWYRFIQLNLVVPMVILFIGYLLSVASEILIEYKLIFRILAAIYMTYMTIFFYWHRNIKFSRNFVLFGFFLMIFLLFLGLTSSSYIILNFLFIVLMLFFFHASNATIKQVVASLFFVVFLGVVILSCYFLMSNVDFSITFIGGRGRYYFGLTNPNKSGLLIFTFIVLLSFLRHELMIRRASYFVLLLPLLYALFLTGSRTPLFTLVIFLFAYRSGFNFKYFYILFLFSMLPLSFFIASQYDSELLNILFSNRPIFYNNAIANLTLFHYFFGTSFDGAVLDNSYLQIYFSLGVFGYSLFLAIFTYVLLNSSRFYSTFIVSMLCYGFFESILVRPELIVTSLMFYLVYLSINRLQIK